MTTNLAKIRKERRLTTSALSARLSSLGRPILANGITKIEKGARRVDVDDLVALALALDVTPNRLLLPDTTPESAMPPSEQPAREVSLTPEVTATPQEAWRWASGESPLPTPMPWAEQSSGVAAIREFQRTNRPHDAAQLTFDEVLSLREKLTDLWEQTKAVSAAKGVPISSIADFMLLMRDWERFTPTNKED